MIEELRVCFALEDKVENMTDLHKKLVDLFGIGGMVERNIDGQVVDFRSNSSAFGFLLHASSHAKPLRGGLMHPSHYAVSRTLQRSAKSWAELLLSGFCLNTAQLH